MTVYVKGNDTNSADKISQTSDLIRNKTCRPLFEKYFNDNRHFIIIFFSILPLFLLGFVVCSNVIYKEAQEIEEEEKMMISAQASRFSNVTKMKRSPRKLLNEKYDGLRGFNSNRNVEDLI